MKALPLWQPWATLVAEGKKSVETRGWNAPREIVGQRIVIRSTVSGLKRTDELRYLADPDFAEALAQAGYEADTPAEIASLLPRGCLLATVLLVRSVRMTPRSIADLRERNPREHTFGIYSEGRYAWVLRDVEKLPEPLPFTAQQRGIVDVPDEMLGIEPAAPRLF